MADRPHVSVVIPTLNRWPLLADALRGALGQEDVEHEVVVVDDGSTDETPERLAAVADPRLRVIRHERPQGVARARNDGIAQARGEWVAFLDDDDLWSPRKLRAQLDAAAAAGADFVYAAFVVLDQRRRPIRAERAPHPEDLRRLLLVTSPAGGPSTVMARTELVRRVGGFDESLAALADWDLLIRLAQAGRPAVCREVLVGYVEHGHNMMVVDDEKVTREFERLAAKHGEAARAAGFDFGSVWLGRWHGLRHRRAGRRLDAAKAYLRVGFEQRDLTFLPRAVAALLGEHAMRLGHRITDGPPPNPDWLARYR